jgi:uncharacterized protein (TIGR02147 family)
MPVNSDKPLPVIFNYLDCAKYLRDYYTAHHESDPWFSYKFMQEKTGVDPGYMVKVFQGKKHLAQKTLDSFVNMLKLRPREAEYFRLLVLFGKAKSDQEIKIIFEKMLPFVELGARKIEAKSYEYYTKWYHAAIREILAYYPFTGDYKALARMTVPEISAREAKSAVALLLKLGFIEKNDEGRCTLTSRFITSGDEWQSIAIRQFQKDTIMLAHRALDNVSKELRDISTVTVTLSEAGFVAAREKIRTVRREILELARKEENAECAYHLNLQLFPIGKRLKDGGAA